MDEFLGSDSRGDTDINLEEMIESPDLFPNEKQPQQPQKKQKTGGDAKGGKKKGPTIAKVDGIEAEVRHEDDAYDDPEATIERNGIQIKQKIQRRMAPPGLAQKVMEASGATRERAEERERKLREKAKKEEKERVKAAKKAAKEAKKAGKPAPQDRYAGPDPNNLPPRHFGRREMAEKVVPTLVQEGETVALPDVEEDDDWYQD